MSITIENLELFNLIISALIFLDLVCWNNGLQMILNSFLEDPSLPNEGTRNFSCIFLFSLVLTEIIYIALRIAYDNAIAVYAILIYMILAMYYKGVAVREAQRIIEKIKQGHK